MRTWVWSLALLSRLRIQRCHELCCSRSSGPTLLWMWYRPPAIAPIPSLAWDLPYAIRCSRKKTKKKKKKRKRNVCIYVCVCVCVCVYIYDCFTLVYSRNWHKIVNQLYFNKKLKNYQIYVSKQSVCYLTFFSLAIVLGHWALGSSWVLFYGGTNPIHGGSTLMTQSPHKSPPPYVITLGIRFQHMNLEKTQTFNLKQSLSSEMKKLSQ